MHKARRNKAAAAAESLLPEPEPEDEYRSMPPSAGKNVVVFQPMGRRVSMKGDKTLLELAQEAGVALESTCGGKGICGKCRVQPSQQGSSPSEKELELLGPDAITGERLACQTSLPEGGVVWVPEQSLLRQQVILTTGHRRRIEIDPLLQAKDITITFPARDKPRSMTDFLLEAVPGSDPSRLPLSVLQELPTCLREESGRATLVTGADREIIDVTPGWGAPCLGLAVDLGTTTVVAYLFDLATGTPLAVEAGMNPQVTHGDDVISRIAYCGEHPHGLHEMSTLVRESIDRLVRKACVTAGVEPDRIMDCIMVGNTAMHHIFLGLDPKVLSQAPYAPVADNWVNVKARQAGLSLAPEAWLHWLPVKAGFVGADTIAVALAVDINQVNLPTLILDLGTNGEMILAVTEKAICCSAAAGPAFEGGHITYGMRAAAGAVEKVVIDPSSLECSLTVIGDTKPLGLCGSGLLSLISQLVTVRAILPNGSFNADKMNTRLRSGPEGLEYVVAFAEQNGLGRDLVLTSKDVAEIQLAKGAIRAGVEIMMKELEVESLGRIILAGAFGNYLDPDDARNIGLFPAPDHCLIESVGNAAGEGAIMALINRYHRNAVNSLTRDLLYLELTTHDQFHDYFVDGMAFPDSEKEAK
jgi:uncharacterized 2Fe-2S/4Fe-4S cluster protein (DUF4445 family)